MNNNSDNLFDLEAYKLRLEKELKAIINTPTSKLKKEIRIRKQVGKFIEKAHR